ncbi:hypothetical protein ISN45_Aa06g000170, partial [Arabidopsis thaliana x Arabidopsis arenosa]
MVWKLKVSVRAKGFSLKLNLRNQLSLQRLSILLRFRKQHHHLKSKHSDCGRCLGSLLALFRRRKRREVDTKKKLMELVWNRAVAKKARGVGVVITLILVIIINYLVPSHSWINKLSNSESFRLDCYELFG